jgi:uncharacterized membrane protein
MEYLIVKWLHILSSTVLFGAGVGSAFHLFMATIRRDAAGVAAAARTVVIADWVLTTPTALLQPATGFYLVQLAGWSVASRWVFWSIVLYAVAIACWLPVLYLQIRMRDLALQAHGSQQPLPRLYWSMFNWWTGLGSAALLAFLAVFYLMTIKPS